MSAHRLPYDLATAAIIGELTIPDPGDGNTIPIKQSHAVCPLTIVGEVETRVLPDPTVGPRGIGVGCRVTVVANHLTSGICTIGDSLGDYFDFATEGDAVTFDCLQVNGAYAWVGNRVLSALSASVVELNRAADVSTRIVNATASTLAVTEAVHDGKVIVLDRAAGIAVTLPTASAGLRFRFIVKTTFTGAATIKSAAGADIMIGHALMGNNTDNTVVDWQAVAASTYDTIDMLGTSNSTGGMAGQEIEIIGLAANLWYVSIRGDAAGTEATPFADTVA